MIIEDSVNHYQRQLKASVLLTAEREKELAVIIRSPDSTDAQQRKAIDELINSNLKLVNAEAFSFSRKTGVELQELVSAGHEGIMKAVTRFDPSKGYRFSTYALWWIRQAIFRKLNSSYAVKIPFHIVCGMIKQKRLEAELGELTDDEVMDELNVDSKTLARIKKARISCVSLDGHTSNDMDHDNKDRDLGSLIADENAEMPDEKVDNEERYAMLHKAVDELSDIKKDIIKSMSLDPDGNILKELGERWNLTGERIRQLKCDAIKELRFKLKKLKDQK